MNTIVPAHPFDDPPPALEPADADAAEPHARTLSEHAYHQLRQHIIEGHYPPGAKLRVEHLKDVYGVGAGTLREALTRLVSDALVVAEGQRGFRVTSTRCASPCGAATTHGRNACGRVSTCCRPGSSRCPSKTAPHGKRATGAFTKR
jgi:hypothetical protein